MLADHGVPEWLQRLAQAAQAQGVEIDLEEALTWRQALEAAQRPLMQEVSGVFGHPAALLDFSPQRLSYIRTIAQHIALPEQEGVVETALALSGSAAQSRIQTNPGDLDFLQRVNLKTATRAEAHHLLARLMREKALETLSGPTFRLIEVKFGSYPFDVVHRGRLHRAGRPISWTPQEVQQGFVQAQNPEGDPVAITWQMAAHDPGWCKLDWVWVDPLEGRLVNVSNMLDVTWEDPGGQLHPLDGFLDPHFQEVYLDPEDLPLLNKLLQHLNREAREEYVRQLEAQVHKYLTDEPNYGKAAKRMYNIFRLTGRYEEAAYLRELFDEPAAALYQVWSLIRTLEDCCRASHEVDLAPLLHHTDRLILQAVRVLEGEDELRVVHHLLRLRGVLGQELDLERLSQVVEAVRAEVLEVVNQHFYRKLMALPSLRDYILAHQKAQP